MLIGELSKRSGFPIDTIRFYEKKGLIAVNRKDRRENNYKEYSEEVFDRLILIKNIKTFGFTLNEIDEFIADWGEENASCSKLTNYLEKKIKKIDDQIRHFESVKSKLHSSFVELFIQPLRIQRHDA